MAYETSSQEEILRKGPWLEKEDETLTAAVALSGERHWDALAKASGLRRSGKSCRLRWLNYLRPNLKRGEITAEEELTIIQLHKQWGSKWAKIARRLPGRTDNEIKNYWRSHLRKKLERAKEQENFGCMINDGEKDSLVPSCDYLVRISSSGICDFTNEKDGIWLPSDVSSCAFNELSTVYFQSSPYEARVPDWMSTCSTDEQSEVKHQYGQSRDCLGPYTCFCCTCWSYDQEEKDASVWDFSSSLWS